MALVNIPQQGGITAEDPTSRVSGGDVARSADYVAQGAEQLGQGLEQVAVPLAQQAGEQAAAQSVSRDANGNIQMQTPQTSFILGRAGEAYQHAVLSGTVALGQSQTTQDLNQMRVDHSSDPAAFKTAANGYLDDLRSRFGDGALGNTLIASATDLATQHYDGLVNSKATSDVSDAKSSIQAQITASQNDLGQLARQGGTNTPEFGLKAAQLHSYYDALEANPLFQMPKAVVDNMRTASTLQLQGEGIVGHMDAAFSSDGVLGAEKQLHDGIDKMSGVSDAQRSQLVAQGEARIQYLQGQNATEVAANKQNYIQMDAAAKSGAKIPDDAYEAAIKKSTDLGDSTTATQIRALHQVYGFHAVTNSLAPSQSAAAQGVGGSGASSPSLDQVQGAIHTQESGGRATSATSVDGAQGGWQVTPATFAQYSNPSESINNPADNETVGRRILKDYYNRYNGDAARVAVAYFSGPGNVAPAGSATPYIHDAADGNGKTTSSYVADVTGRLGGGAPPASVNGVPFTKDQLAANPFLLSTWVQKIARDQGNQETMATTLGTSIEKSLQNGIVPTPTVIANYAQLTEGNAKFADQRQSIMSTVEGQGHADVAMASGGQPYMDQVKAAAQGGSIYQGQIAMHAQQFFDQGQKALQSDPGGTAAAKHWVPQAPAPLDFSQPDSIASGIAARSQVVQAIGTRQPGAPQSVVFPNEKDQVQTGLAMGSPQASSAFLQSVGQLPPAQMQATLNTPEVKNGILGMAKSGDSGKMTSAYSFMDQVQRQNPMTFDGTFGKEALGDLRAWQDKISFDLPAKIAQDAMKADDPGTIKAKEALRDQADESLKNVTGKDVVNKFAGTVQRWNPFGSDYSPVGEAPAQIVGALRSDYVNAYRDQFAKTSDAGASDKYAMERVGQKWGMSDANGGRVMAFPPERSPAYPQVNGSQDWIKDQIADHVHQSIVQSTQDPETQKAMQHAAYGLVPDQQTEAEMSAGKPPGYNVVVQGNDGRMHALMLPNGKFDRFYGDPVKAQAKAAQDFAAQRQTAQDISSIPAGTGSL
jgi:hypothetical protein